MARAGEDKYFDMRDMEKTAGSWDLYGQDDSARYNALQSMFFERATDGVSRRESLRAIVALGGAGALLTWGAKGSKDANLPITKGPQKKPEASPNPRGVPRAVLVSLARTPGHRHAANQ